MPAREFMLRVLGPLVLAVTLVAGQSVAVAPEPPLATLAEPVHFSAPDGGDALVPTGAYRIERADAAALRLTSADGRAYIVRAQPTGHTQALSAPMALSVRSENGQHHVALLFGDGAALDAVGSYSGVRSRGIPRPLNAGALDRYVVANPALAPVSAPAASAPTISITPPVGAMRMPTQLPPANAQPPTHVAAATGAPPVNFRIRGAPMRAYFLFDLPAVDPNTIAAEVFLRADGIGQSMHPITAEYFGAQGPANTIPDDRQAYEYVVRMVYQDGSWGDSPRVAFTSPPPVNPAAATATDKGGGGVQLAWQPVDGAFQYRIDGPGIGVTGLMEATYVTTATVSGVPPGPQTWRVTALYGGNVADYQHPATATTIMRMVPAHAQPWLTKNNGPGSSASAMTHYLSLCPMCSGASFHALLHFLGVPDSSIFPPSSGGGGDGYGGGTTPAPTAPPVIGPEAIYSNVTEFGTPRQTRCWVSGTYTVCYVTSPGPALDVIVKQGGKTWFLPYAFQGYLSTSDPAVLASEAGFASEAWHLTDQATLDSEGPKLAPNACIACHGGVFDPGTGAVTNATLLPLDPGLLQFATDAGHTRADQENNIRQVNAAVMGSIPSVAVARYLFGLYGGDPRTRTMAAQTDFVPQGWNSQASFYKMAIRPYCVMCHLATPSYVDFSSADGFYNAKPLIYAALCSAHTMPHAEFPFRTLWTKDTGQLYLPGLLAASLGYSTC